MTIFKMTVDKMIAEKMTVDKMIAEKMTVDKKGQNYLRQNYCTQIDYRQTD